MPPTVIAIRKNVLHGVWFWGPDQLILVGSGSWHQRVSAHAICASRGLQWLQPSVSVQLIEKAKGHTYIHTIVTVALTMSQRLVLADHRHCCPCAAARTFAKVSLHIYKLSTAAALLLCKPESHTQ